VIAALTARDHSQCRNPMNAVANRAPSDFFEANSG
jgi:hypothetical protein